jgi:hypothetical protein
MSARSKFKALGAGALATAVAAASLALAPAGAAGAASSVTVGGATTTALKTSKAVAYNTQKGTLTATVKPVAPARGAVTGSVDFYVDGGWSWSSPVVAGKAKMTFADLGVVGVHDVTATYTGDGTFELSSSGVVTQTILPAAPTAGITFTPATIATGGTSRLVVSATNNTPVPMPNAALGVVLKLPATVVAQPLNGSCRRSTGGLLYCMTSLPVHATRKLVLDVTGSAPGAFQMVSYARNTDTGEDTQALATLTVQ